MLFTLQAGSDGVAAAFPVEQCGSNTSLKGCKSVNSLLKGLRALIIDHVRINRDQSSSRSNAMHASGMLLLCGHSRICTASFHLQIMAPM